MIVLHKVKVMGKRLFQAGLSVELPCLDIEETVYHFNKWDLQSRQMQAGRFSASVSTVHTPCIQLHDVLYSHGFLTRGSFPEECVMLGYVETRAQAAFQNRVLLANELVISTEGSEIDYLSNGENRIFTISVEKELFEKVFFSYFGKPFELYKKQSRFFIKPQMVMAFGKRMKEWMVLAKNSKALSEIWQQSSLFESAVLEEILSTLIMTPAKEEKSSYMKVKKARDLLHASVSDKFEMSTLMQQLGIGQRQLQRSFKETYGISPKRYLLNLRLNEVRKELLCADPASTTISSIALKYYFFDLSHFSKTYKELFFETPSCTLNREM